MTGFGPLPIAEHTQSAHLKGTARILGPKWGNLPALTIGLLAVQIFWSVEMSYASPYLISLGLTKSKVAGVFVAGPLSGLIMQPLIGVLADSSTSRFGRRRPYMLLGTMLCMLAMLLLGFTRQVAAFFTGYGNTSNNVLTVWLAVLSIFLIDFSINAVQAMDRALLVDTLPPSKQAAGNAWAARMLGVGSVIGFFVGNVDLPRLFPFLGSNQLQVLTVAASALLLGGHVVMAVMVKEKVLVADPRGAPGSNQKQGFLHEIKDIWKNIWILPRVIQQIFIIQFFAWIGWFPVLFYTTVYVGDLHKRSVFSPSSPPSTPEQTAALDAEATRLGSRALFYSSVFSLFLNLALPAFVRGASSAPSSRVAHNGGTEPIGGGGWRKWDGSRGRGGGAMWAWLKQRVAKLARMEVPRGLKIGLADMWAMGHFVFACCMAATFFAEKVTSATVLITITGFSWAVTQWAPFSLLAQAILTSSTEGSSSAGGFDPLLGEDDDSQFIRLADARRDFSGHTRRKTRRSSKKSKKAAADVVFDVGDDDGDLDSDGEHGESDRMVPEKRNGGQQARKSVRFAQGVMGNSSAQLSRLDVDAGGGASGHGRTGELGDQRDDGREGTSSSSDGGSSDKEGEENDESSDSGDADGEGEDAVDDDDDDDGIGYEMNAQQHAREREREGGLSAKAGVILGIHNVFIVIPQFLVTGLSAVLFALIDPQKSVLPPERVPSASSSNSTLEAAAVPVVRADPNVDGSSNSVVYIFRLGGVAACVACVLCWRLARELRHR